MTAIRLCERALKFSRAYTMPTPYVATCEGKNQMFHAWRLDPALAKKAFELVYWLPQRQDMKGFAGMDVLVFDTYFHCFRLLRHTEFVDSQWALFHWNEKLGAPMSTLKGEDKYTILPVLTKAIIKRVLLNAEE